MMSALPSDFRPDVRRGTQLFIAAFGALALAHALGLRNPFWAAMPVWVVSQPWRQDILIRGGLRLLGTMLGAGVGFAALAAFDDPVALAICLALTAGVSVTVAYWIGTIYSYGALMTSMTCAVVMLPALAAHDDGLALAVDRTWCTVIGGMAVTLATVAFTPPREEPHRFRFEEHGLAVALRRGGVAAFCAVAGIALVLATESFVAVAAALSICIFSSIIGSMADPRPVLKNLLPGATLGVLAGLVYRLGGDALGFGPEAMLLFAALFILAGAMIRATPRIAPLGLDGNMCFLLSAEVGARGHGPVLHVTSAIALLAGAGVMVLIYRALLARQLV